MKLLIDFTEKTIEVAEAVTAKELMGTLEAFDLQDFEVVPSKPTQVLRRMGPLFEDYTYPGFQPYCKVTPP